MTLPTAAVAAHGSDEPLFLFVARARALADEETQRRSLETEGRAELVLKVAEVGKVSELRIVDEEDDRGRLDGDLGGVEHLQLAAASGVRAALDGLMDDPIELARW